MILHRACILGWIGWNASSFFEWLAQRPWYAELLSDWVATTPTRPGEHGLEVGSGPGLLTAELQERGLEMTGLDRSALMVERARKNVPSCTFLLGDALSIPLSDNAMDVAYAASVVNVMKDPQGLVTEMARTVKPGGYVSVLFPTPRLADDLDELRERLGLTGLSGAALEIWGSKAPKRETAAVEELFVVAGLLDIRVDLFFGDTVAGVTGRVA